MLVLLFVLLLILAPLMDSIGATQKMNGVVMDIPDGYVRSSVDTYHASWQDKGTEKKPGWIILNGEIKGNVAQQFSDVESVIETCDWLSEPELYVNPQKIRTVRGYSMDYQGGNGRERRYYVETPHSVLLLSMQEDPRYYSIEDCEEVLLQLVDSIRIP